MSNGHPAKECQPSGDRTRREGDIIVTAVGGHYAIGRLKADGEMQQYLESLPKLAGALRRASVLAGPTHQVFMYPSAGTPYYRLVDCAEIARLRRIKGLVTTAKASDSEGRRMAPTGADKPVIGAINRREMSHARQDRPQRIRGLRDGRFL